MASPVLRDTIKKLKDRRAALQKQIRGPLRELAQIEEDLAALGAGLAPARPRRAPASPARRAPRGATLMAVLRAIRNGATTPEEIAARAGLPAATVRRTLSGAAARDRLVTEGPNGLTLTKAGRERMARLEARP
ncbi:hypothetical protein FSW04_12955 [Baekduia soli]|uniref:Uncharacterized protein n=1 Tax=Baekduia soli TaxID=496014 RepID=A0A5B8U5X2_9ACTN|nr:hypothetical protein [Baekduia soli]QEC48387.1 hypothetical protein FSW04_12955 [Baekduia soli]